MMQSETSVGWQDYLTVVLRRRWFFLAPFFVIVMVSMVWGLFLPKIYRAEAILLVQDESAVNPLIEGLAVSSAIGERMRILREEMLSWTSLSRLVNELRLDRHTRSPEAFENLIRRLQRDIGVRIKSRDLVTISFEDRNPELAQRLVNTITSIYMDRSSESQTVEAKTASNFLQGEMTVYKKKLEDAERALRDFKELYAMQMPVANDLNDQIVQLEILLAQLLVEDTEVHPAVIQTRRRIVELKQKRNEELRRVIAQALAKGADPKIYQDLFVALDQPLSPEAAQDPKVRAAKEAYDAWVHRLDNSLATPHQSQASTVPLQMVTAPLGSDAGASVQVVGAGAPLISLAPRQEQELARLTRDYEVYSSTYQQMQQRLERARITQRMGESDQGTKFKILEPARLPLRPARPNMAKIFIFSLLLGVFVGAAVAFIAEYLDQSFQTAEDVQAALELPVIGTISTILTQTDLEARQRQRKGWVSLIGNAQRFKRYVLQPAWSLVDKLLVKWGL